MDGGFLFWKLNLQATDRLTRWKCRFVKCHGIVGEGVRGWWKWKWTWKWNIPGGQVL